MSKNRVASNLLILGSGQLATWAISTGYILVISRYLGPQHFGELTLALAVVSLFTLVTQLGTNLVIVRSIARQPERGTAVASAAMIVRLVLVLPVPIVLYVYIHAAHVGAETASAIYILAVAMLFESAYQVFASVFQAHERMSYVATGDVIMNCLLLTLASVVILLHGGVDAFAATTAVTWLLVLVLGRYWGKRFVRLTWRVTPADIREVAHQGLGFWANAVFLTFYIYIDSLILAGLAGPTAVGFYAPPGRIFSVALFVPSIVAGATLPMLSRLGVEAGSDFAQVGRKTLSLLVLCAVPLAIGIIALAGPIITLLYGPAFRPSIPVLMVMAMCIPFTFLNAQFSRTLGARNQQWRWTGIMAASCIVNPVLNFLLIPFAMHRWSNGALGASLALLATEALMTLYALYVLRDVVIHREFGWVLLWTLIAAEAQACVLYLLGQRWVLAGEILGAAVYLSVSLVVGTLPKRDVMILLETALHRPRQRAA